MLQAGSSSTTYMSPRQRRRILEKIRHRLNTSLCQFTASASKTKKAIDYIKHFSIISRMNRGISENGIHHMTIILTNNSLLETKMWKHRLIGRTKELNMNICSLSSKKDSTFNNVDQIITRLVKAKSSNSLPDILVMCTHGTRTSDIINLFTQLESGNLDFTNIGIHQITATVMFDEADKNIGLIADFLKELNKEILYKMDNTVLRDIHFITATPGKKFWKKLKNANITELENIHHYLRDENVFDYNHEELYKDYRSIDEHNIKKSNDNADPINNTTGNPVVYASAILKKILKEREDGLRSGPLIVFAPSEMAQTTHDAMAKEFIKKKFTVLILNGEQKGFQSPDGSFETVEQFNQRMNISGELYDTLVKWRSLDENKNKDIAITGYLCVQRGVTFCTIGFNFTDIILSTYHLNSIDDLVQILGRANGEKQYVQVMNIWAPPAVIEEASEMIYILNELHKRDPEVYNESDFRKKTPRELKAPAMTIPDDIQILDEEWAVITKKNGNSYNSDLILATIEKMNPELHKELKAMTKKQITMPEKEESYKKHITDLRNAVEKRQTFSIDITKKELEQDVYQIFLDNKLKRLIVSRHYGSRIANNNKEE